MYKVVCSNNWWVTRWYRLSDFDCCVVGFGCCLMIAWKVLRSFLALFQVIISGLGLFMRGLIRFLEIKLVCFLDEWLTVQTIPCQSVHCPNCLDALLANCFLLNHPVMTCYGERVYSSMPLFTRRLTHSLVTSGEWLIQSNSPFFSFFMHLPMEELHMWLMTHNRYR